MVEALSAATTTRSTQQGNRAIRHHSDFEEMVLLGVKHYSNVGRGNVEVNLSALSVATFVCMWMATFVP
jgi:hypothetical protein